MYLSSTSKLHTSTGRITTNLRYFDSPLTRIARAASNGGQRDRIVTEQSSFDIHYQNDNLELVHGLYFKVSLITMLSCICAANRRDAATARDDKLISVASTIVALRLSHNHHMEVQPMINKSS